MILWCRACIQKVEGSWAYGSSLDHCPGDPACTLHASCRRWGTRGPSCLWENHLDAACHQPGTCTEGHSHISTCAEKQSWLTATCCFSACTSSDLILCPSAFLVPYGDVIELVIKYDKCSSNIHTCFCHWHPMVLCSVFSNVPWCRYWHRFHGAHGALLYRSVA